MKKKIFITLFLVLILLANISFASYNTVTMSVVEEPICTIDIGNNSKFEKKLISKDLKNKEVTLQLQVTNNEAAEKPTGELVIVMDNSNSMTNETSNGKTRKDLVFNSAKTLVNNLLKDNNQLKIAIVSFSTNSDISKEASSEDAFLESKLESDVSKLNTAIDNIKADGARTDLQAGLQLGKKQFSSEKNNKYMIVLTDGVPNVAIGHNKPYYSDDVISATKQELQSTEQSNINLSLLLTGINDENTLAGSTNKTFKQIIEEIFGTTDKPTAGDFYYIDDNKIEETIINDIYNSLLPIKKTYKDITIIDYFPEEIIKNFNFAYVTKANIGTISEKVDTTTNSITWTIPELASGQTATVQYKLKLKENFDSNIVGKILNTNKKQDITYTDTENKKQTKTSDISPKIKLLEPDTAPMILPKTGILTLIIIGIIIGIFSIFSLIRFLVLRNKMK